MASASYDTKQKLWTVRFRWPVGRTGRQHNFQCDNEKEAKRKAVAATELIGRLTDPHTPQQLKKIPSEVENEALWIFSGGNAGIREVKPDDKPITILELIDQFLDNRKDQIGDGEGCITVATYADDKYQLNAFADFCEKQKQLSLDEVVRPDFLDRHKASTKAKSSVVTLWHSVKAVKRLLTWGWKHNRIEALPRNLDDYARVERPKPMPKFFTVDEVKALYAQASPRSKLYILLALNGGFTQVDIATLTHSMIDWKAGIISRDRNKTGIPQSCKLWPITLTSLKEHSTKTKGDNLALVSEEGNPLVYDAINDTTGRHSKVDSIRSAFNRLEKKCKMKNGRSFKAFRKTGADTLAAQYQTAPYIVDLYLAHAADRMRQHYTATHFDELHKATDWLATVFGFAKGGQSGRKRN
jgi:integrase